MVCSEVLEEGLSLKNVLILWSFLFFFVCYCKYGETSSEIEVDYNL